MKNNNSSKYVVVNATRNLFGTLTRRTWFFRIVVSIVSLNMLLVGGAPLWALPQGASVTSGSVSFDASNSGTLIINQTTGKAAIDWTGGFNIGAGEWVRFAQPGASSVTLNRDLSGSMSEIWGNLHANGYIYLLNQNGILFGAGSSVNVGGLIAAAMSGMEGGLGEGGLRFTGNGGPVTVQSGASINAGKFAYLVGSTINNAGTIQAGEVVLAAGPNGINLVREPDGSTISVVVGGGDPVDPTEAFSQDLDIQHALETTAHSAMGKVENTGVINVSGLTGGIILLHGTDVYQSGTIRADGSIGDGGMIYLLASDSVAIGGDSVTTANAGANGDGGNILNWVCS